MHIRFELDGEMIEVEGWTDSESASATVDGGDYYDAWIDWGYDCCPLVCLAAVRWPYSASASWKRRLLLVAEEMFGSDCPTDYQCEAVIAEAVRRERDSQRARTATERGEECS